jgi:hypothetical protein
VLSAAAALQIALATRVSAATRHLVWTLAIAGALLLPPLAVSLPDWSPVEYTEPAGFVPILGAGSPEPHSLVAQATIPRRQSSFTWAPILTTMYLAGVVLLLMRVVLQHLWTHRLVRAATPITEAPWLQLFAGCSARIGVRRPV